MSSASSGRYQSRLFNFVHKQSRRWGEGLGRTLRHLQVAATWSLEALMYPVFMLIQKAVESVGKQLHAGQQQRQPRLQANDTDFQPETPLVVDTPILRVLEAVKYLHEEGNKEGDKIGALGIGQGASGIGQGASGIGHRASGIGQGASGIGQGASGIGQGASGIGHRASGIGHRASDMGEKTNAQSPIPNSQFSMPNAQCPIPNFHSPFLRIQGIASQLTNRNLVLITTENEILDILTPQQQQKLEERIIAEIANYWRHWRLNAVTNKTNILSEIDRLLAKLTSGNNDNKLMPALALNTDATEVNEYSYRSLNTEKALILLDAFVANLESNALVPVSRASWELIQVARNQLNLFVYGKEQTITASQATVAANGVETQTPKIKALIWAALNFFFGERKGKKLEQTTPVNTVSQDLRISAIIEDYQTLPTSSQLRTNKLVDDPWLNESDLFGEFEEVNECVNNQKLISQSPTTNNSVLPAGENAEFSLQNLIYQFQVVPPPLKSKPNAGLVQRKKSVVEVTRTQKTSRKLAIAQQTGSAISHLEKKSDRTKISQQQQTSEIEIKSDCIETKAKLVRYEKHPLEQILEWLDSLILGLEELFVKVFRLLRRLWGGK